MTAEEKWDKIVSIVQAKKPAKENEVEDVWADIFSEIFGYSKIDEEIERQRKNTDRLFPTHCSGYYCQGQQRKKRFVYR